MVDITISNERSVPLKKSVLAEILRDYLKVNHVPVPDEGVNITLLVDKAAFPTSPDNTDVIKISWTEAEDV